MIDLDEFVQGYLDGILFTERYCEDDESNDSSLLDNGCGREDFSADAVQSCRADCEDFIKGHRADLELYCELRGDSFAVVPDSFGRSSYSASECAGTDFWLSRNGHGAGFFDRGLEPVFDRLQDAAGVYGSVSVMYHGEIEVH